MPVQKSLTWIGGAHFMTLLAVWTLMGGHFFIIFLAALHFSISVNCDNSFHGAVIRAWCCPRLKLWRMFFCLQASVLHFSISGTGIWVQLLSCSSTSLRSIVSYSRNKLRKLAPVTDLTSHWTCCNNNFGATLFDWLIIFRKFTNLVLIMIDGCFVAVTAS